MSSFFAGGGGGGETGWGTTPPTTATTITGDVGGGAVEGLCPDSAGVGNGISQKIEKMKKFVQIN